jgi:cell division protein FtsQ
VTREETTGKKGSSTGKGRAAGGHQTLSRIGARMDPRIRARRTAVMKEQGRRRLIIASVALGVAVLVVGGWSLVHTSLFAARSVTVTGNVHETAAQVVTQAGLAGHPPLVDIDTGAAAARLEKLPWVREASVRVSWPDGVHIAVTEETPTFTINTGPGTWESLSNDGRVLEESASRPPGLLLLTVPQTPGAPGTVLSTKDSPGLQVASTLPASFVSQVTGVTVEPAGWVQLALTTPIVVDIGTATQLTAKYEDVSAILAGASLHNGDVIDVSVPDAPTVTSG